MILVVSPEAEEQLKALPKEIRTKADRQFKNLLNDYRHPSLRTRKMSGTDTFEARIDFHYRFTFLVEENYIYILSVGPHDTGLGKK